MKLQHYRVMALVQKKKGGRYTKKEQEVRKLQVYDLYVEQDKPAVEIAEILNVNRNTINKDVKYWKSHIASEFNPQKIVSKLTKQIQRMEIQRDRLLDDLEIVDDIDGKIKLEKLIFQISNKLVHHHSKIILDKKHTTPELDEINEDVIREFIRELVFADMDPESMDEHSENGLKFDFIKKEKCDINYAERIIEKMKQCGLELCSLNIAAGKNNDLECFSDYSPKYNIMRFASMRGYFTMDEFSKTMNKRRKNRPDE